MSLEELILQHNRGATTFMLDPWAKASGSQIHLITPATVSEIARLIRETSALYPLATVPILAAWIAGESMFDPQAINPNNQEAAEKPNLFERTDYGLVQVDGLYMSSHHDMAGLTQAQMIQQALDPTWAVEDLAQTCTDLLTWAKTLTPQDCGPYSQRVLGFNAYNKGKDGTLEQVKAGETLVYGPGLEQRVTEFEALLAD